MNRGYDPELHRRRSIRLKGDDYSSPGAYFVTIVVQERLCLFGDVVDGEMRLNEAGGIIVEMWNWMAERYSYVELDAYVVMPNHLHGVVVLTDEVWHGGGGDVSAGENAGRRGVSRNAPTGLGARKRKTLGRLVGAFKTVSTKRINEMRGTQGERLWQRDFYERVIRDDRELDLIREYIEGNPAGWDRDEENPYATRDTRLQEGS